MKLSKEFAQKFADHWIHAWNNHDIESIMSHYDDDIEFSSPFILKVLNHSQGSIRGKQELRKYFEQALEKNPNLNFDLKNIMLGIKSITLIYIRNKTMLASEVMIFNHQGLIMEGLSHYPIESID